MNSIPRSGPDILARVGLLMRHRARVFDGAALNLSVNRVTKQVGALPHIPRRLTLMNSG